MSSREPCLRSLGLDIALPRDKCCSIRTHPRAIVICESINLALLLLQSPIELTRVFSMLSRTDSRFRLSCFMFHSTYVFSALRFESKISSLRVLHIANFEPTARFLMGASKIQSKETMQWMSNQSMQSMGSFVPFMALRIKFHSLSVVLALARLAQAPCLGSGSWWMSASNNVSVSCKGHEFPTFAACCCALTMRIEMERIQTEPRKHFKLQTQTIKFGSKAFKSYKVLD